MFIGRLISYIRRSIALKAVPEYSTCLRFSAIKNHTKLLILFHKTETNAQFLFLLLPIFASY